MAGIAWPDIAAPALFLACWVGYSRWADRSDGRPGSLMAGTAELRRAWMRQMLAREVRIVDTQIVSVLVHAIALFASSVVLVIGSGVAMLGARDKVMDMIGAIPFAAAAPPGVWEAKVLLLVVVFVHAFFKFTWSLRQFNYVVIMIGAAPPPGEAESPAGTA